MDEVGLLLKAYWEQLHDRLVENKGLLSAKIDILLKSEIDKRGFPHFDADEYAAYQEAAIAFVEERIEAYNPVGLQYLFDAQKRREAVELEFGLDWFDGRGEFERVLNEAEAMVFPGMSDEQLRKAAGVLIRRMGAYPDRSIIAAYEASPAMLKLPDYVVARAIEEIIS